MSLRSQQLIIQMKNCFDYLMTNDQHKKFDKLQIIFKQLLKNSKQFQMNVYETEKYFNSIQQQLEELKKDILNNKKKDISDYQAFLWYYDICQKQKEYLNFIAKKPLLSKVSLSAKSKPRIKFQQKQQMNILTSMKSLSFNPLNHCISDLIQLSTRILFSIPYCQKHFQLSTINNLICQISKQYLIVSYHNFTHAFSVQLMFFQCLNKTNKFNDLLTDFQIFITYIAALGHDMGHAGTNSDYEIKMKTVLSKTYNNQSILQNMHISKLYKMFRKHPQNDIISLIKDPVQRQRSKRLLLKLILNTDMSKHFQGISKLKSIHSQLQKSKTKYIDLSQKQIIHQCIFHACDIGNCCLEYDDFINWAILLSYQFNSQYELEINNNLTPTVFFKYDGQKMFYKGQVGFIDNLAAPLWKVIYAIYPKLDQLIKNMQNNKEKLKKNIQIAQ